jgi:hypothetical protein
MTITASRLRQDVYRLLDQVLDTGKPLEIERKGHVLRVVPDTHRGGKLATLTPHACIKGDPEAIVHCDWSSEWSES